MPARSAGDSRGESDAPGAPGVVAGHLARREMYLTNGVFLYRVLDPVASGVDEVELEDCYGLDVVCVPLRDLHARGLRVVTPASSDG
jgi:hypothetical protein